MLKEISWIVPKALATNISGSLAQKLDSVKDANGDLLYLYLTPVLSEELVLATASRPDRHRTDTLTDDENWHRMYYNFAWKTTSELDRSISLEKLDTYISSFIEEVEVSPSVDVHLLAQIGQDQHAGTSDGVPYVTHSAASVLGGSAVAMGAAAVLISSVYNLTLKNLDRFVTRVFPLRHKFASGHCKYLAQQYEQEPEARMQAKFIGGRALEILNEKKEVVIGMLERVGWPTSRQRQHSLPAFSAVLSGAQAVLPIIG
ncbi:hypothetical protein ANTQUA_LOCUS9013 [Anthophora quadrimaculata]